MLRDIKTRFFGNEIGFLVTLAWPLSHIGILLLINLGLGRVAPYGQSSALWYATGIVPFMAFSYMSRFMCWGVVVNRSLLVFPAVKILDILFSRAILEVLSAACVILILAIIFWVMGVDFMPIKPAQAFLAVAAAMLLGLGCGVVNSMIAAAWPLWLTVYNLLIALLWFVSGVLFVPDALPESIRYPLSFNPVMHSVEWMRSAYYEGYGAGTLDKQYLLVFALLALCYGLVLERMARGRLLQG